MALFLDVGPDDALRIGPDTFLTVERKSGSRSRLRIVSTSEVELMRGARLHPPYAPAPSAGDEKKD
jgi:hypothetical protein